MSYYKSSHENAIRLLGANKELTFKAFVETCESLKGKDNDHDIMNATSFDIGDEGAKVCADMLRVNTTLVKLTLCRNNITIEGAKMIADALMSNTTLQEMHFEGNKLGDGAMKLFSDLIKVHKSLVHIGF